MNFSRAGIIAMKCVVPKYYITAEEFGARNICSYDKLTQGLRIKENGVLGSDESVVSLATSALSQLIKETNINVNDIGRLDVGSETNPDSAKSLKSALMSVLHPNSDVLGSDNVQACYGGTAAVLNAMAWLESPFCNKKYAVVVCTDGFFYDSPDLYPLSSAGAVAILLGYDPVFTFSYDIKNYSEDCNDFLKPKKDHPKTVIDGKKSIDVYMKALDACKFSDSQNYYVYHTPYPKLIIKIANSMNIPNIENTLTACIRNGNTYTASVYFAFYSLLSNTKIAINETVSVFSFGSGCGASLFILKKVRQGMDNYNINALLDERKIISYDIYKSLVDEYFNK